MVNFAKHRLECGLFPQWINALRAVWLSLVIEAAVERAGLKHGYYLSKAKQPSRYTMIVLCIS